MKQILSIKLGFGFPQRAVFSPGGSVPPEGRDASRSKSFRSIEYQFRLRPWYVLFGFCFFCFGLTQAEEARPYPYKGAAPPYTQYLDPEFPFKELTLAIGEEGAANRDILPRALILPLEREVYVAFDTELLRVAGIWQGKFSDPLGVSFSSYALPLKKIGGGFGQLPTPGSTVLFRSGVFPGWQDSDAVELFDTRSAYIDEREPGRGPMDTNVAVWKSILDTDEGAVLTYQLFGAKVQERFQLVEHAGEIRVERRIGIGCLEKGATLLLPGEEGEVERVDVPSGIEDPQQIMVQYGLDGKLVVELAPGDRSFDLKKTARWKETVETSFSVGEEVDGYALDLLDIPYPNPWKRRIRPADIEFREDGSANVITFDGDLYRLTGFESPGGKIVWQRIAAGFNEPQTIAARGDELFVYSRGGVSRLWDLDGDYEIDRYEMFCNRFVQSPDTRDFPSSVVARRDGTVLISKCGQQVVSLNPHSGRVLEISSDGEDVSIFASGLRNAFLAYDSDRDLLTASDQQGEWVPSTPLHRIERGGFYGFEKSPAEEGESDVTQPLLWFPYRLAPSGVGQVHGFDERSMHLFGSVLFLDYKRPSMHKVNFAGGDLSKASTRSLSIVSEIPLLNGDFNPADGMAYVAGFQIWDSDAPRLEGIGRLREVEMKIDQPTSVRAMKHGILLSYPRALDRERATDAGRYQVAAWDYERTALYGSAQYNKEGAPGVDSLFVHSVHASVDARHVFLAIEESRLTMQLEVLIESEGQWNPVHLSVAEFDDNALESFGFEEIDFADLFASAPAPREEDAFDSVASATKGQELYTSYGCVGCHSIDGSTQGKSGPSFLDLFNRYRVLSDGSHMRATREYLRESILEPSKKRAKGYDDGDVGMPPYAGILKEEELESILLFLESL